MKRIRGFALIGLVLVLLIGLFLFKDYGRYDLKRGADDVMFILDTRTGEVWGASSGNMAGPYVFYMGKAEQKPK